MAQSAPTQPVAPAERILALDVLRGFAMVGVLVAYCLWSLGTAPEASWSPLDRGLNQVLGFAIDGKFYTILAFLFGLGFSLQLERAANSSAAVRTYCRRLTVLAAIGLVHALLLRNGDILLPYAVTGFFLIPFRRASDRIILAAAVAAILLLPHAARWVWQMSGVPLPARPDLQHAPYFIENAAWVLYWYQTAILNWPLNLTLFLFGYLAGRHRAIPRLTARPRALSSIIAVGLLTGTALFFVIPNLPGGPLASLAFTGHCWGLSSAYAAAVLLALRAPRGTVLLAPLAPLGRMALTNYLLQAGLVVPLCLAFGWFDAFTPSRALLLALAVFLVQLPLSAWWLRRYRFGPAEWVWRLLTYGRVPPLRLNDKDYARA